MVSGGESHNVIPAKVELGLDARRLPGVSVDEMIAQVRGIVAARMGRRLHAPVMVLCCLMLVPQTYAQTVTLNLKDADLKALVSTVADVTGKNFVVDQRVQAIPIVLCNRLSSLRNQLGNLIHRADQIGIFVNSSS